MTHFDWPDLSYRGLDREPDFYRPQAEGPVTPPGEEADALWEEVSIAEHDKSLQVRLDFALDARRRLEAHGFALEVVYAELAESPAELGEYPSGDLWQRELSFSLRLLEKTDAYWTTRQRPAGGFLGFDISWPVSSFHSALHQPGWPEKPGYKRFLNAAGLFENREVARAALHRANLMDYGPVPFCMCAVWSVEDGSR